MPAEAIRFAPVTSGDLPLLARWLATPHWRQWWGEPETELGYIRDMIEGRDSTRPYLFHGADGPLGYIQVWRLADAMVEPWLSQAPWMREMPKDAVGTDIAIGPEAALGRGFGSTALRAFAEMLRAEGQDCILIDPDATNLRAVRCYEKAGFEPVPGIRNPEGSLIMRYRTKTP